METQHINDTQSDAQDNAQGDATLDHLLAQAFAVRAGDGDALSRRLGEARREHHQAQGRHLERRRRGAQDLRRGGAMASVAGVLALAVVAQSRIGVRGVVTQMGQATLQVRSMHSQTWDIDRDGSRRKVEETWFEKGRLRRETPSQTRLYTGGRFFTYEPQAHLATWRTQRGLYTDNDYGYTILYLMAKASRWGWRDTITLSPEEKVVDGRRARVATIEPAQERGRVLLYADPQTLLPFRFDWLEPAGRGWRLARTGTMEYNLALQPTLFEPRFPRGTRVAEMGSLAGVNAWMDSLQKPRAILFDGPQRVAIRDVQMNQRGDIFVLYTAGRERDVDPARPVMLDVDKPHLALRVDGGGRLPRIPLIDARPSVGISADAPNSSLPRQMDGRRVDGEPLQWVIWTRPNPLPAAQSQQPERITLWITQKATNRAARRVPYAAQTPPAGASQASFFIERATIGVVPYYVEFFPQTFRLTQNDFLNLTDEARAWYWRSGAEGRRDWLMKALALNGAVIERAQQQWRADSKSGVQPAKWLEVAELCCELGRLDEAREALARAEDDNRIYRIYGSAADGIERRIEDLKHRLPGG